MFTLFIVAVYLSVLLDHFTDSLNAPNLVRIVRFTESQLSSLQKTDLAVATRNYRCVNEKILTLNLTSSFSISPYQEQYSNLGWKLKAAQESVENENFNETSIESIETKMHSNESIINGFESYEPEAFAQIMPLLLSISLSVLFFGGMISFVRPMMINAADSVLTFSQPMFDPSSFQPVCPASDGFYQFMKSFIATIIGQENIAEYGPLIASGKQSVFNSFISMQFSAYC